MKWVAVVGGVALACVASLPSRAADVTPVAAAPYPYKAAPAYMPAYFSWTGYYFGLAGGGGFGNATMYDPGAFSGTAGGQPVAVSLRGGLVGGYTGVNYQVGSIVFGVEGDFIGSWAKGNTIDVLAVTPGDNLQVDILWTGSLTARLGLAVDRLLFFGKAGGAFVYHRDTVFIPMGAAPVGSATTAAWTVGGGLEWAFTEHWIVRGEYDYLKLPLKAFQVNAPPANSQVGASFNELKGGVAYKF